MLHTLGVFQGVVQNGHDVVGHLVLHINLHLVHTLTDIAVEVTVLKLTVVNSKTGRDGLGADRILTPIHSGEGYVAAGCLESRIDALVSVGLHHGSLVVTDSAIGAHEVEQANNLQQLRLNREPDDGVDLATGGVIAVDSLAGQLFDGCNALVQSLVVNLGSLTGAQSRKYLHDLGVLLDTTSIHISLSVAHVDFINRAHRLSLSFSSYCTRTTTRTPLPMYAVFFVTSKYTL